MIMHNKTLAEMLMIQLENNKGLFGVRNLIKHNIIIS